MILHLRAKPNARVNQLLVDADGSITVRLKARPQNGQANACLLAFLAESFGISKGHILLLNGHTAPFKKVELLDVDEATALAVLARCRGTV